MASTLSPAAIQSGELRSQFMPTIAFGCAYRKRSAAVLPALLVCDHDVCRSGLHQQPRPNLLQRHARSNACRLPEPRLGVRGLNLLLMNATTKEPLEYQQWLSSCLRDIKASVIRITVRRKRRAPFAIEKACRPYKQLHSFVSVFDIRSVSAARVWLARNMRHVCGSKSLHALIVQSAHPKRSGHSDTSVNRTRLCHAKERVMGIAIAFAFGATLTPFVSAKLGLCLRSRHPEIMAQGV